MFSRFSPPLRLAIILSALLALAFPPTGSQLIVQPKPPGVGAHFKQLLVPQPPPVGSDEGEYHDKQWPLSQSN